MSHDVISQVGPIRRAEVAVVMSGGGGGRRSSETRAFRIRRPAARTSIARGLIAHSSPIGCRAALSLSIRRSHILYSVYTHTFISQAQITLQIDRCCRSGRSEITIRSFSKRELHPFPLVASRRVEWYSSAPTRYTALRHASASRSSERRSQRTTSAP